MKRRCIAELARGLAVAFTSQASNLGAGAPPPSFGSASPFGKRKKSGRNPLVWAVLGLGVIALLALAWFVIKFVGMK